jgi:hypothetical protein
MTHAEYATLIFYWYAEPANDRMDQILSFLSSSGLADKPGYDVLRVAAAVQAFEELDPTRAPIWRMNYPYLYKRIDEALRMPKEFNGWADYLVVKWMILRQDKLIIQLLERAGRWGEQDKYTAELITKTAKGHGPFRWHAERLRVVPVIEVLHPVNVQ